MKQHTHIVYGPGGYDPKKPKNNIIETATVDVPQEPLSPVGALATMLAVTQVLAVTDAANAVGLTVDDLVAEAHAWAAASLGNSPA